MASGVLPVATSSRPGSWTVRGDPWRQGRRFVVTGVGLFLAGTDPGGPEGCGCVGEEVASVHGEPPEPVVPSPSR